MREYSEFIYIHKNGIVITICATIVVLCSFVIYALVRTPSYPQELVAIDSICNSNPQKAYGMLEEYKHYHNNLDSDTEWYFRFLVLKSNIKNNKEVSDTKEADAILRHYEEEANEKMLSQVYYYAGCAYSFLNEVPQAVGLFQKGLSIIPEIPETERLRALYYYMLGYQYTYQYLNEDALVMKQRALDIHSKHNDLKRMLYDYISIAQTYKSLCRYKKAIACLKKAEEIAGKNSRDDLPEINSQIADVYYEMGEYHQAKKYIECSLKEYDDDSYLFIAARVYDALGDKDKAKPLYRRCLNGDNIYRKRSAYRFFAKYYKDKGDIEKAYINCMLYSSTTDSIVQTNASEYSAKANAAFNYKHIKKENEILRQNIIRRNVFIIAVIVFLLSAMSYTAFYILKSKRKYESLCARLAEAKNKDNVIIERSKAELARIKERLSSIDKENIQLQQDYKKKQMQLEKLLSKNELLNKISISSEGIWKETDIYNRLARIYANRESVNQNTINWVELEDTLFSIYPTFKDGLSQFKPMKNQARHVCLLIKASFNTQQIAYFTSKTVEAISSTKRRLYIQNFNQSGSAKDWDAVIISL